MVSIDEKILLLYFFSWMEGIYTFDWIKKQLEVGIRRSILVWVIIGKFCHAQIEIHMNEMIYKLNSVLTFSCSEQHG